MIVAGILLFALLVIVHELGHFIAARRSGVAVDEFGVGFPPRILAKRLGRAKTLYSLNLIPLGGFVRLKGEANSDKRHGSFGAVRFWTKAKILLAGVGMNLLAVYVILLLLAFTGLPNILLGQFSVRSDEHNRHNEVTVARVEPDSVAAKAGMQVGDKVVAINAQAISTGQQLRDVTAEQAGQQVALQYRHGRQVQQRQVRLGSDKKQGYLGVIPVDLSQVQYRWSAPLVALVLTAQIVWGTLIGIFGLLSKLLSGAGAEAAESVAGPVGVYFLLQNVGSFGFNYLLLLIASISASLAVVNALPIPALDGGRLAVIGLAQLFKKRLSPHLESLIHSVGFVVLIGLVLIISYIDVQRFF